MKVAKTKAVELLTAITGSKTASKWTLKRLTKKINDIDNLVDDETNIDDKELNDLVDDLLEAVDGDADIEVVEDEELDDGDAADEDSDNDDAADEDSDNDDDWDEEDEDIDDDDDDDETEPIHQKKVTKKKTTKNTTKKAPAKKNTKKATATKAKKKPAKKTPAKKREASPELVRVAATRAWCAGQVIAIHGLDKGITKKMIADVCKMYGTENAKESETMLKNAWHGVRGYMEELVPNHLKSEPVN